MSIQKYILTLALSLQVLALKKISLFGIPFYFLEVCVSLLIVSLIVLFFKKRAMTFTQKNDRWILLGVTLFLLGAASSFFSNPWSLTTLGMLKSWFLFPALFFIWGVFLPHKVERSIFYTAWFLGSALIAFVALFGFLQGFVTYDNRLTFPYSSPNFLAYLLAPGIFLGLYLGAGSACKKRVCIALTIGLLFLVIYLTHSYNVWLALTISFFGGTVLLFKNWRFFLKKRKYYAVGILGVIFCASMLFFVEQNQPKWQNLFNHSGRSSVDSRLTIWQVGSLLVETYPIQGIGVGNFQTKYLSYQKNFPPYLEWAVPQPHNFFLAVWLQTGIVGLAGCTLLLGRILFLLGRVVKHEKEKSKKEGLLLLSLWSLFLLYGLFDTPYFRNDLAFLFWLQVVMSILYIQAKEETV